MSAVRGGCSPHTSATMRDTGTAEPGDEGEHGQHGLALGRADIDRLTVIGRRGDPTEEPDLHLGRTPFHSDRRRASIGPSVRPGRLRRTGRPVASRLSPVSTRLNRNTTGPPPAPDPPRRASVP